MVRKLASHTRTRLLGIRGIYAQICLELGEDFENSVEFGVRLGCMAHGSELTCTLRRGEHKTWGLIGGVYKPEPLLVAAHLFYSSA